MKKFFFVLFFAALCIYASDGYVLISPDHPNSNNRKTSSEFVIDYYEKGSGKCCNLITMPLGGELISNRINWLQIDYTDASLFFSVDDNVNSCSFLYFFSFKDGITQSREEFKKGYILSAWKKKQSKDFVFLIWDGKSRCHFYRAGSGNINKTSKTENEDFDVPSSGNFLLQLPTGGPYFHWNSSQGIHFFSHPEVLLPALKHMPPKELYQNRENPRWLLRGDIGKTFVLFYNPYHSEVERGRKSVAGIYFDKLKTWKILNLEYTECFPVIWDDIIVIQQCEQNSKSRPEQYFSYTPRRTGIFTLIDPDSGAIRNLTLSKNTEILYASKRIILAKNGKELIELSLDDFWNGAVQVKNKVLFKSENIYYVKYAFPRSLDVSSDILQKFDSD